MTCPVTFVGVIGIGVRFGGMELIGIGWNGWGGRFWINWRDGGR